MDGPETIPKMIWSDIFQPGCLFTPFQMKIQYMIILLLDVFHSIQLCISSLKCKHLIWSRDTVCGQNSFFCKKYWCFSFWAYCENKFTCLMHSTDLVVLSTNICLYSCYIFVPQRYKAKTDSCSNLWFLESLVVNFRYKKLSK